MTTTIITAEDVAEKSTNLTAGLEAYALLSSLTCVEDISAPTNFDAVWTALKILNTLASLTSLTIQPVDIDELVEETILDCPQSLFAAMGISKQEYEKLCRKTILRLCNNQNNAAPFEKSYFEEDSGTIKTKKFRLIEADLTGEKAFLKITSEAYRLIFGMHITSRLDEHLLGILKIKKLLKEKQFEKAVRQVQDNKRKIVEYILEAESLSNSLKKSSITEETVERIKGIGSVIGELSEISHQTQQIASAVEDISQGEMKREDSAILARLKREIGKLYELIIDIIGKFREVHQNVGRNSAKALNRIRRRLTFSTEDVLKDLMKVPENNFCDLSIGGLCQTRPAEQARIFSLPTIISHLEQDFIKDCAYREPPEKADEIIEITEDDEPEAVDDETAAEAIDIMDQLISDNSSIEDLFGKMSQRDLRWEIYLAVIWLIRSKFCEPDRLDDFILKNFTIKPANKVIRVALTKPYFYTGHNVKIIRTGSAQHGQ